MKLASQGHIRDILFPSSAPFAHTHLHSHYTFLVSVLILGYILASKDVKFRKHGLERMCGICLEYLGPGESEGLNHYHWVDVSLC